LREGQRTPLNTVPENTL